MSKIFDQIAGHALGLEEYQPEANRYYLLGSKGINGVRTSNKGLVFKDMPKDALMMVAHASKSLVEQIIEHYFSIGGKDDPVIVEKSHEECIELAKSTGNDYLVVVYEHEFNQDGSAFKISKADYWSVKQSVD